jgi:hypothetical protein
MVVSSFRNEPDRYVHTQRRLPNRLRADVFRVLLKEHLIRNGRIMDLTEWVHTDADLCSRKLILHISIMPKSTYGCLMPIGTNRDQLVNVKNAY